MIGAPPPPIICHHAADAIFVCLIILMHFSCLPQRKIESGISRQHFLPMSGLQNLTLKTIFLKSPNLSESNNFQSIGFDF